MGEWQRKPSPDIGAFRWSLSYARMVRYGRERQALSQRALAERMGLSANGVVLQETMTLPGQGLSKMLIVSAALGVTPAHLVLLIDQDYDIVGRLPWFDKASKLYYEKWLVDTATRIPVPMRSALFAADKGTVYQPVYYDPATSDDYYQKQSPLEALFDVQP